MHSAPSQNMFPRPTSADMQKRKHKTATNKTPMVEGKQRRAKISLAVSRWFSLSILFRFFIFLSLTLRPPHPRFAFAGSISSHSTHCARQTEYARSHLATHSYYTLRIISFRLYFSFRFQSAGVLCLDYPSSSYVIIIICMHKRCLPIKL